MSESRKERRTGRAERSAARPAEAAPTGPAFAVVASGENVVMVNTHSGQTWVMTSDGGTPVWHPVAFEGSATRAPRRTGGKKAAASD